MEKNLRKREIHYVRQEVIEGGLEVDKLFFHDPDNFMIEICNCDNISIAPLDICSCSWVNLQMMQLQQIKLVRP